MNKTCPKCGAPLDEGRNECINCMQNSNKPNYINEKSSIFLLSFFSIIVFAYSFFAMKIGNYLIDNYQLNDVKTKGYSGIGAVSCYIIGLILLTIGLVKHPKSKVLKILYIIPIIIIVVFVIKVIVFINECNASLRSCGEMG